ncbi:MAG: Hsp20/alpha crystallin family protein [Acidimicrobiales bacterium]
MSTELPTRDEVADATAATEAQMRPQAVPVNMYETSGALMIVAPLPAVTAADVTIELRDDCLRFWAHLRSAAPREYLVHEWEYGGYEREVEIPDGFGRAIEASLANGQLAIRILRGERPHGTLTAKPNSA